MCIIRNQSSLKAYDDTSDFKNKKIMQIISFLPSFLPSSFWKDSKIKLGRKAYCVGMLKS
jgi:hypothetical protein